MVAPAPQGAITPARKRLVLHSRIPRPPAGEDSNTRTAIAGSREPSGVRGAMDRNSPSSSHEDAMKA